MSIRSYKGGVGRTQIDIHPGHGRTKFVRRGCKNGVRNGRRQHFSRHVYRGGVVYCWNFRKVGSVLSSETVASIIRTNLNRVGIVINAESYRLLREVFQGFDQDARRHRNISIFLSFHLELGHHGGLQIRSSDGQYRSLDFKKKVFQNRHHRVGGHYTVDGRKLLEQGGGRNNKFHIVGVV